MSKATAGYPPIQHAVPIQAQLQVVVEPQMVRPEMVYAQHSQPTNSVRAWGDASHAQQNIVGGFSTTNQSNNQIGGAMQASNQQYAPRFTHASPPLGAPPGTSFCVRFSVFCCARPYGCTLARVYAAFKLSGTFSVISLTSNILPRHCRWHLAH